MRIRCECWACRKEGGDGTKWASETTTCPDCNAEMDVIDTVVDTHHENGRWYHDTVTGRHGTDWICKRKDADTGEVHSIRFIPMEPDRPARSIRQQREARNTRNRRSVAHGGRR